MRPQVIVVDDEEHIRRAVRRTLLRQWPEAHVAEAASAEEAIEVLAKEPEPHLAIVDLHVYGRSGVAIATDLRALVPDLPVLFMTGDPLSPNAAQARQQKALGILEKPFSAARLIEMVRSILDGAT